MFCVLNANAKSQTRKSMKINVICTVSPESSMLSYEFVNNEQTWLPGKYGAIFELTLTWPNLTSGRLFTWIGTTNNHIWLPISTKQVILRNVRTDFNLTQFIFWSTFDRMGTYSTNHVYLHRPNAFGFWQMRLHLCYETLKRISNFSELA